MKPPNPLSRARIERIADRTVPVFGLIFGLQAFPTALEQLPAMRAPWALVVMTAIFGGLAVTALLAIVERFVRVVMGAVAVLYCAAVITWPLLVRDAPAFDPAEPWIWFLCSVFTAFAAVVWPFWLAMAYTVLTPIAYGVARASPAGGAALAEIAILDAIYAITLGGVILGIIAMMRQASSAVDSAQSKALAQYGNAVRQHATEAERVHVDAIVHDSVLATLLSAASAHTLEQKELAGRMAAHAIERLNAAEAAGSQVQSQVGLGRIAQRLATAATAFSLPFAVDLPTPSGSDSHSLPFPVAEAVCAAAMQAMVNSSQHAGGAEVRRSLTIRGGSGGTVQVVVDDSGRGFAMDEVPAERLGLRVSIRERLAQVGGLATIRSAPGQGTTVTIVWPAVEQSATAASEPEAVG